MFQFHKPRVYRSLAGCCICKAKSSSSRFTSSLKYEDSFQACFHLASPRQGEICNACVLLVKRFKQLPCGTQMHWEHVVDARSGPGTTCMSKCKKKIRDRRSAGLVGKNGTGSTLKDNSEACTNLKKSLYSNDRSVKIRREVRQEEPWNSEEECSWSDEERTPPPLHRASSRMQRKACRPVKCNRLAMDLNVFLESTFWKRENVCCGSIWKGPNGEIVVDTRFFTPCDVRRLPARHLIQDTELLLRKNLNDNSSDSGYDESSNPMQTTASLDVQCYTDNNDGKESPKIDLCRAQQSSLAVSDTMNSHRSERNSLKQQGIIIKHNMCDEMKWMELT